MTYSPEVEGAMRNFYRSLSEKDRRRYAAVEAAKLGHGGKTYIAQLFGCDPDTIAAGMRDVEDLPADAAAGRDLEQVLRERPERHVERLLDQRSPEAGTIDEQVSVDAPAVRERQAGNVTAFGITVHLFDPAFNAGCSVLFSVVAQERCIQRGVELVGVTIS